MLDNLLRVVGVDLQSQIAQVTTHFEEFKDRQIAQVKAHLEEFKDRTKQEIVSEVKEVGITAGLALGAFIAFIWTCVIALIALFLWVQVDHGPFVALAVVGTVTLVISALLLTIAATRGGKDKTKATIRPMPYVAKAPPRAAAAATSPPPPRPRPTMREPLNLASIIPPPPPNASLYDVVAHRVTTRAAGAADEAIDTASDIVGKGSRGAMVATLAATVLVGLLIGRRRKF